MKKIIEPKYTATRLDNGETIEGSLVTSKTMTEIYGGFGFVEVDPYSVAVVADKGKAPPENAVVPIGLLADIHRLLDELTIKSDEDSCMGMCFVEGRISEDWFYSVKNKIEKQINYSSEICDQLPKDAVDTDRILGGGIANEFFSKHANKEKGE